MTSFLCYFHCVFLTLIIPPLFPLLHWACFMSKEFPSYFLVLLISLFPSSNLFFFAPFCANSLWVKIPEAHWSLEYSNNITERTLNENDYWDALTWIAKGNENETLYERFSIGSTSLRYSLTHTKTHCSKITKVFCAAHYQKTYATTCNRPDF